MLSPWAKLCVLVLITAFRVSAAEPNLAPAALDSLDAWFVEQMPGGQVEVGKGRMLITDVKGCTVWLRQKLTSPVSISYDAVVRSTGRVSDLNCFWMASDARHPERLFPAEPPRTGAFAEYDRLQTYYVGYGGNTNTTSRFRRYEGNGSKPLLPEYDLRTKPYLLEPDRFYHIELIARDGWAEFRRDGELIFRFHDPRPLERGWFALRTVDAQIEITHLRISVPDTAQSVTVR